VRATGPLDYESAAFDDAFVIRQISEAEILAGHGQVDHAVQMLREILNHAPENVQVHLKLKDIYLRAGVMNKAAMECLELARIHEVRGEQARASDFMAEAHQLNPLIAPSAAGSQPGWGDDAADPHGLAPGVAGSMADHLAAYGGFEVRDDPNGFDLSKYQTGVLEDQSGFVTVPGDSVADAPTNGKTPFPSGHAFSYDEALYNEASDSQPNHSANATAGQSGARPANGKASVLRDELEGIDFYIAQGYFEIAQDTLSRLLEEYGNQPDIIVRCKEIGMAFEAAPSTSSLDPAQAMLDATDARVEIASFAFDEVEDVAADEAVSWQPEGETAAEESVALPGSSDDFTFKVAPPRKEAERPGLLPFLVQKESGPLHPDLLVKFNTSELLNDTAFDMIRTETGSLPLPTHARVGTADLIDSLVSNIDSSLTAMEARGLDEPALVTTSEPVFGEAESRAESLLQVVEEPALEAAPAEVASTSQSAPDSEDTGVDLNQIFEEIKENTGNLAPLLDYETHYSLGLAYKDMELFDDAIEQFQMAFKVAGLEDVAGNHIQCCHMLGVCFNRKQMPDVAVMWFERGLKVEGRTEDEYQALRYEIGQCYEEMGEFDKAIVAYSQVYGIDVNYRNVGEKIKRLQALKGA
ncbi:MAG TPA: tetratricopeptide repeat protein, partial [Blastocatellia bacterium]|nr:tetratricopeptide repeat protein [Blastocatellia bacterium]